MGAPATSETAMGELEEIFGQGDADLRATAGEKAVLVRRLGGERLRVRVVCSPAEQVLELPSVTGGVLVCDRVAHISRSELTRKPDIGDRLELGGQVYEVMRVTGWAYDASWHVDIALRRK